MIAITRNESVMLSALLWTARILSVTSVGLLLLFVFGEGFDPARVTPSQWVGFMFFPLGVAAGMIVSWWREGLGGVLTVGSLLGFYVWHLSQSGSLRGGWAFFAFSLPGFLFLLYGLLSHGSGEPGADAGLSIGGRL
jgi:hypothetical protein